MPIRRKRSSPTFDEARSKKVKVSSSMTRRSGDDSDGEAFSSKRCIAWFHEYTGPDEDTLGPEGMEKFCEDTGVEPENVVMLALAWKLEAKTMGFFTLAEWLKGMTELQSSMSVEFAELRKYILRNSGCLNFDFAYKCDCTSKVQAKLDYLRSLLDDPIHFKNIYRYAFDFARGKDQRSMDIDTAKAMLTIVLGRHWSLFGAFHQFLDQSKYKAINKDQWCNILEFSRTIYPDLSNYDEDGAWPVLLDEFVEWLKEQRTMSS